MTSPSIELVIDLRNLSLSILVVGAFFIVAFLAQQSVAAAEPKSPLLLKSTIAIDDSLSPMPAALSVGNEFSGNYKLEGAEELWYRVPPWLAGLWKYRANEIATFTDLKTGKTRKQEVKFANVRYKHFGSVKDSDGVIWDLAPVGRWHNKMYQDQQIDWEMTNSGTTKIVDDSHFVIKSVDFFVVSQKGSSKILNSGQAESVTTYTKNPDSSVSVHVDSRNYNSEGNAQTDRVNTYVLENLRDVDFRADTSPEKREAFVKWLSEQSGK